MSWDYAYAINALTLADVATFATVEDELPSPFSDTGVFVPGRDGVLFDPEAPFAPLVLSLRVHLRWTNAAGGITHMDGDAGHIYENLSLLKTELGKPAPTLFRTVPHVGAVRAVVKSVTPGLVGAQRHVYVFPLTVPSGSWQTVTESSEVGNPPVATTSGTRRIPDPVLIFSGAGTFTYTDSQSVEYEIVAGAGPTYPVTVDVGAGTVVDNASVDARGDVSFSHRSWLRLDPASALSITTDVSVTLKWRDRWG